MLQIGVFVGCVKDKHNLIFLRKIRFVEQNNVDARLCSLVFGMIHVKCACRYFDMKMRFYFSYRSKNNWYCRACIRTTAIRLPYPRTIREFLFLYESESDDGAICSIYCQRRRCKKSSNVPTNIWFYIECIFHVICKYWGNFWNSVTEKSWSGNNWGGITICS